MKKQIETLIEKGVSIPAPESVEIGEEVSPDRIGKGVVLYPGVKLYGKTTLILEKAVIGYEGPVTVQDCQIGPEVHLKGGFFKQAVFLEKASLGCGAHIREGCILEEEASVAHTVGLKQTILFPFVTLGSLINFCDCFMAGGTSRKDHSEVGSSYIHFNYTPNQDKATPSLLGDVPSGVMLNQRPIFLGGQGGLVGPCRLAYGTIIAAGTVYRKDEDRPDRLLMAENRNVNMPFTPGLYRSVRRIMVNNIGYIANLLALRQWYIHVRSQFIGERFPEPLWEGLNEKLNMAINERIKRLGAFCEKMPASIDLYRRTAEKSASDTVIRRKQEIHDQWPALKNVFEESRSRGGDTVLRDRFLESLQREMDTTQKDYIASVQGLKKSDAENATRWLSGIVETIAADALQLFPALGAHR